MKKWSKRILALAMILFCCFSVSSLYAETTQQDIDDAKDRINEIQDQKDAAEDKVDSIENEKSRLQGDLENLNDELSGIVGQINDLETQIAQKEQEITDKKQEIEDKQQEITEAQQKLEETEEEAEQQYEDMKLRIQFMYENTEQSLWTVLLESDSVADFLNRTEYITEINKYDRKLLLQYQELLSDISEQKAGLDGEMEELVAMEEELESEQNDLLARQEERKQKQNSVNELIASTRSDIVRSEEDLADAQESVEDLTQELQKMIDYEAQLELQKAKEDAERLAAIQEQEKEDTSGVTYTPEDSDQYLLGAIIQCEAEGEPYEGKLAVGSVVMNRVKSSYFPNSVSGVIYQSGQFSPVASGRLAYRLKAGVSDSCLQAAKEVLDGKITVNCLYFRRNNGVISGTVIGNHVFY